MMKPIPYICSTDYRIIFFNIVATTMLLHTHDCIDSVPIGTATEWEAVGSETGARFRDWENL